MKDILYWTSFLLNLTVVGIGLYALSHCVRTIKASVYTSEAQIAYLKRHGSLTQWALFASVLTTLTLKVSYVL